MKKDELIAIVTEAPEIIYENYFFEKIKGTSLIEFRNNINIIQSIKPTYYLEKKVDKYYDELINRYNIETLLFYEYDNLMTKIKEKDIIFFKKYDKFTYLINKEVINEIIILFNKNSNLEDFYKFLVSITNEKISEIIVDSLFKDSFYNVRININEMLRYHNSLPDNDKFLTKEQISFYKTIFDIDKKTSSIKIKLYNKFKNKNINLMFYHDLRKMKDLSYKKINQSMIDITKHPEFKNKNLSNKFGIDVYDMRDKEYFMLVSSADDFSDKTASKFGYYTLLSNKNTDYYKRYKFLYGFSSFPKDRVLHVLEEDAGIPNNYELDSLGTGFKKVNRIMTPEQIVMNGGSYSEINILNNKSDEDNKFFKPIEPSFLVVIDNIEEKHVKESNRLNIPIVIIKKQRLDKTTPSTIEYKDNLDDYTIDEPWSIESLRKRNR